MLPPTKTLPVSKESIRSLAGFAPALFSPNNIWKKDCFAISVATSWTKNSDRVDYRFFTFDESVRKAIDNVVAKRASAKLQLLDENADVIATERFIPEETIGVNERQDGFHTNLVAMYGSTPFGNGHASRLCGRQGNDMQGSIGMLAIVGPAFDGSGYSWSGLIPNFQVKQKNSMVVEVSIKLSLEEIKLIKDAKVEIAFENGK